MIKKQLGTILVGSITCLLTATANANAEISKCLSEAGAIVLTNIQCPDGYRLVDSEEETANVPPVNLGPPAHYPMQADKVKAIWTTGDSGGSKRSRGQAPQSGSKVSSENLNRGTVKKCGGFYGEAYDCEEKEKRDRQFEIERQEEERKMRARGNMMRHQKWRELNIPGLYTDEGGAWRDVKTNERVQVTVQPNGILDVKRDSRRDYGRVSPHGNVEFEGKARR